MTTMMMIMLTMLTMTMTTVIMMMMKMTMIMILMVIMSMLELTRYKRGEAVANYSTARTACEAESSNLASVSSETENLVVHSVLTADGNNNNGWLGATDTEKDGTWVWDDGSVWDYQNWFEKAALGTAGGTVQNCVQIRRIDYTWDDIKCSAEKWFVCKK